MIRQNLHMHTTFDDGKNSPREMIEACRAAGLSSAGVSLHSPMPFLNDWAPDNDWEYRKEMRALQQEYQGVYPVYVGIELDVVSTDLVDTDNYDYVIGSVHHLPIEGNPSVDGSAEEAERTIREYFHGKADAAAEMYFGELLRVAENPAMQICGHFDLLTKFDELRHLYNPESARFRAAAGHALDALCEAGKIFEINTGAISRGYRTTPYPSRYFLTEIRRRGGKVLVSSDAHAVTGVTTAFREAEELMRSCGYTEICLLDGKEFRSIPLD